MNKLSVFRRTKIMVLLGEIGIKKFKILIR